MPVGQLTDVLLPAFSFPFRAHLAQVIGENERGAAAIRSMHDHDFLIGQVSRPD